MDIKILCLFSLIYCVSEAVHGVSLVCMWLKKLFNLYFYVNLTIVPIIHKFLRESLQPANKFYSRALDP